MMVNRLALIKAFYSIQPLIQTEKTSKVPPRDQEHQPCECAVCNFGVQHLSRGNINALTTGVKYQTYITPEPRLPQIMRI